MNDARLDAVLAAADPLTAPLPEGIGDDAVARAARERIAATRRGGVPARRVALAAAGFAALAALVVALIVASPRRGPAPETATAGLIPPSERHLAPGFSLPVLVEGESHSLGWAFPRVGPRSVTPHPLVIVFADSWCLPCRAQLAQVQRLWETTAVGDLAALGIARRSRGNVAWWNGTGATFPLAIDRAGTGARAFGLSAEPETLLIDRRGRVAARLSGVTDPAVLDRAVDALLAEPAPPSPPEPSPIPGPAPPSVLHLGVFDTAPSGQAFPPVLPRLPGNVYADSIRSALTSPSGRTVWIARGGGDRIAIASTGRSGVTVSGTGPARAVAAAGGILTSGTDGPGEPWYLVGIALDGYTRATGGGRSVPIRHNAFIFEGGRPFTQVTVTGPAGSRTIGG